MMTCSACRAMFDVYSIDDPAGAWMIVMK
jgi:hypothetical protein